MRHSRALTTRPLGRIHLPKPSTGFQRSFKFYAFRAIVNFGDGPTLVTRDF